MAWERTCWAIVLSYNGTWSWLRLNGRYGLEECPLTASIAVVGGAR